MHREIVMTDDHPDRHQLIRSAVQDHQGALLRYASGLAGQAGAADAVQETLLRLWSTDHPPDQARLAQWLFTVCRNAAFDARRKDKRMSQLDDAALAAQAGNEPPPSNQMETQESTSQVISVLGKLPENQQEVVRLKFQNGFSYRQIAEITGLSEGNVGFLIHKAIKTIRARVDGAAPAARA